MAVENRDNLRSIPRLRRSRGAAVFAAALFLSPQEDPAHLTAVAAGTGASSASSIRVTKQNRNYADGTLSLVGMPEVRRHPLSRGLDEVARLTPFSADTAPRREDASRILAVTRALDFARQQINPETVRNAVVMREHARESFGGEPVFRETSIAVFHSQVQGDGVRLFYRQNTIDSLHAASAHVTATSGFRDATTPTGNATRESLESARTALINGIEHTRTPLTAAVSGHGVLGGGYIELGAYTASDGAHSLGITPEILAHALAVRYENEVIRERAKATPDIVILDACYSGDFAFNLMSDLSEQETWRHTHGDPSYRLPPLLIISDAEVGHMEYIGQLYDDVLFGNGRQRPLIRDLFSQGGFLGIRDANSKINVMLFESRPHRLTQLVEEETDTDFG